MSTDARKPADRVRTWGHLRALAADAELWLSANLTAWHFVHREGIWVERDSGEPMLGLLSRLVTEKVGQPVSFAS